MFNSSFIGFGIEGTGTRTCGGSGLLLGAGGFSGLLLGTDRSRQLLRGSGAGLLI